MKKPNWNNTGKIIGATVRNLVALATWRWGFWTRDVNHTTIWENLGIFNLVDTDLLQRCLLFQMSSVFNTWSFYMGVYHFNARLNPGTGVMQLAFWNVNSPGQITGTAVSALTLTFLGKGRKDKGLWTERLFIYCDENKSFPPLDPAIYWDGIICAAQS